MASMFSHSIWDPASLFKQELQHLGGLPCPKCGGAPCPTDGAQWKSIRAVWTMAGICFVLYHRMRCTKDGCKGPALVVVLLCLPAALAHQATCLLPP